MLGNYNGSINKMYSDFFKSVGKNLIIEDIVHEVFELPEGYLTFLEMKEKFNQPFSYFNYAVQRATLQDVVLFKNQIYFNPTEYEGLLKQYNNTLSTEEVRKLFVENSSYGNFVDADRDTILKRFTNVHKNTLIEEPHYRIDKKEVWDFFEDEFENFDMSLACKKEEDPYKILELQIRIKIKDTKYKYTLEQFKKFAINQLNTSTTTSKNKRIISYELVSSIEEFLKVIPKEINLLTDEDIESCFSKISIFSYKSRISIFLNFYSKLNPNNCVYKNTYNAYLSVENIEKNKDIYNEEEWINYLTYLVDVDKHITQAFERYIYARAWLFTLFHFTVAWRKSDILSIPALRHINIDKYNIEWFKENSFTLTEAQEIINDVKYCLDNTIVNKTKVKNHFIVYPVLSIPFAIAIITTEQHRRKMESENLFSNMQFYKSVYVSTIGEKFKDFSSIKANRSLLTYCFNEAVNQVGYSHIAYSLSSSLRAHKVNEWGLSPVTSQYIYATNGDGDCQQIALHLQKRGVFGWVYKAMLMINENDDLTQNELTELICLMQQQYSVKNIEGISKYLEKHSSNNEELISELLQTDKKLIKHKLREILSGKLPSKIDYTYCLKSDKCPYEINTSCCTCRYSIPTMYTLLTINTNLIRLMDELLDISEEEIVERVFYTRNILQLMRVIQEAKVDFSQFDANNKAYFETFLDMNTIKEKFDSLKNTKFLIINEK